MTWRKVACDGREDDDDHDLGGYTVAENELAGWSLLSWTGPFTYVGQVTVINPDGRWLHAISI